MSGRGCEISFVEKKTKNVKKKSINKLAKN